MSDITSTATAFKDTKPHYALLDGLRGVAALFVVWYHVFEGFQFASGAAIIEIINHGYLAVDFFFILSGFVIGYAYDDRWGRTLSMGNFFRRRLIRLHPMLVMGAVIGVVAFLVQGSVKWDGSHVALSAVMLSLLLAMFFVPAVPGCGYEVRGNGEMFPLNGPSWSLFFEYIGNILYALFIRRLSTKWLAVLVVLLGAVYAWFAIGDVSGYGMIGVGWTLDGMNFFGGLLRMTFPFTMGMLISRVFLPCKVRGAFWMCTFVLVLIFHVPYLGCAEGWCANGVFEICCIAFVFPLLVWIGASGVTTDAGSTRICNFLGNISYPLYIVHYPVMYLFYAWLIEKKLHTLVETWPVALAACLVSIVLAYVCLKFYDIPVRRWLSSKFK